MNMLWRANSHRSAPLSHLEPLLGTPFLFLFFSSGFGVQWTEIIWNYSLRPALIKCPLPNTAALPLMLNLLDNSSSLYPYCVRVNECRM